MRSSGYLRGFAGEEASNESGVVEVGGWLLGPRRANVFG